MSEPLALTDQTEPGPEASGVLPTPEGRRPAIRRLLQIGRIALISAVILGVAYTADREWEAVSLTIRSLSWKSMVVGLVAIVGGMLGSVRSWQHLLAAMGTKVAYRQAAEVNLVGQLGKYLPGSVWAFAMQTQLGVRYRIPRPTAFVALLLSAGVTMVTALTLAVFAAPILSEHWGQGAWILLAGPLTLLTVIPRVLTKISALVLRLLRRAPLGAPLVPREVVRAVGWSFASWLLYGAQLWLLTGSVGQQSFSGYIVATGAFALAMSAGFIAFVLPSGLGVREAVIVVGLSPITTPGPALAIALTSRLLFTAADVLGAVGAHAVSRMTLRSAPPGPT